MSVTTNLGKVACVGKGEFNASTRYEALDIVSYNGSSYLVIAPCSGVYPPNASYYMLLASKGDTGARGERGQTGATGARGEKGDTGTGLDIKGTYASIDALTAAVSSPEQGDMYFVGTAAPYTVYMWDTTNGTGAWISQGALQGTKGDAGAVFTPNVTAAGVLSWTNNGGLTNPSSVNIKGPQGERGEVGVGVPAGGWQGQVLRKSTDADHDTEWATLNAADVGAASLRDLVAESRIDNGDFTQFIAQAGIGGNHGTQAYAGDRWILDSGTVTGEANDNGNGYKNITLNGSIRQKVANPPTVGTAFVEMVSGTATVSYSNGEVTVTSSGGVIKYVDLFEGEYTADDRPKHMPKGYAAELAECQRYFRYIRGSRIVVTQSSQGFEFSAPYIIMRVTPTATLKEMPSWIRDGASHLALTSCSVLSIEGGVSVSALMVSFSCAPLPSAHHVCYLDTLRLELSADL